MRQDEAVGSEDVAGRRGDVRALLGGPVDSHGCVQRERQLQQCHQQHHEHGDDQGELDQGLT